MGENQEFGAVFTKRWVVEAMLDLCGYTPEADLASSVAVEPSCGDGAFLLPMVERLSASLKRHGRGLPEARGSLRAFDLQEIHVEHCRSEITHLLTAEGWGEPEAQEVARAWVTFGDYLLADHASDADFVIGNPPYIRAEDMEPALRAAYLERCNTMTAGTDIFVGFIEIGLRSLKPEGVLCFIVADRWQHNAYGKKLRRMVVDGYNVEVMIELHGVDAFANEVSAYPAITQIRKALQGAAFYATGRETFDQDSAKRFLAWVKNGGTKPKSDSDFVAARLPEWFATDDVWPSGSPERLALLEEMSERFSLLEDMATGTKVGIGIATGADAVFVTQDAVAEPERMLPLVKTEHIRSGKVVWSPETYLVNPWNGNGRLVDLSEYPKTSSYLEAHRVGLEKRHTAQKSLAGWYRTIDKVYPDLQKRPKLLLADMKATIQPVFDDSHYPHHNLYWITSDKWDLKVLGGILLSRVAQMFVEAYGVKMRGGTLRFQAQYLRKIRVPNPDDISPKVKAQLVQAFENRDADAATNAALAAYGLSHLPD